MKNRSSLLNLSIVMRKLILIFLVFIFLLGNGCYYMLFSILQYRMQNEIAQQISKGMKEEDLTLVIIPVKGESGLCWIKKGKEFRYDGQLYDVVYSKLNEHKIYYYCFNDQKEKQFIAVSHKMTDTKKQLDKKIKSTYSDRYIPREITLDNFTYPSLIKYILSNISLSSNNIKIPSPPPKPA